MTLVRAHELTYSRLLNSARVIGDEICFDIKDINNIYEIYNTRFRLHKTIYNHKTGQFLKHLSLSLCEYVLIVIQRRPSNI